MQPSYIHLRVYTDNSLGLGICRIKDLLNESLALNMPAVAVTDYNNLFASLEFSMAAEKAGIQPIIGLVLEVQYPQNARGELLLIARTNTGYKNLLYLSSYYYLNNKQLPLELLLSHADGLIALVMGPNSYEAQLFQDGAITEPPELLAKYKKAFGSYLFIELVRHRGYSQQYENFILQLAYDHNIPIVATNAVAFINANQHEAHDAFICISAGRYVIEDDRKRSHQDAYYKSGKQMAELFHDLPEAIHNTLLIGKLVQFYPTANDPMLPTFCVDETQELKTQATIGLEGKIQHIKNEEIRQEYYKRLAYELSVINNMQYAGYFLIVSDFIKWSKKQNIPVGPGRGSGAGSIVAWGLDITDLDPIEFGLLFERFLNPDRISMPDFDIDFCQERREEVIQYVQSKYGQDKVAQIITFGKLQARVVLRDVGRVLHMPYGLIDKICKMVPVNPTNPVTLQQAINLDKDLQKSAENDPEIAKLLRISLQLEGLNRHVSTHAAGLIIADRPLVDVVPLYQDDNSTMPAVQYSMKYAEAAGLVKFDFLGLKTLTVISWALKLLNARGINLEWQQSKFDDPTTYQLLSSGNTVGVFQFESAGMKEAIKKLRPDSIGDLIALGSLYRPGPMDNIPSYINRKHGLEQPQYLHPQLEPILQETYGIIVYQEQVMQIARELGGYTLAGADLLRRAMGKKIKAEMDEQRHIFINGAIANGLSKMLAEEIFALMEKFASYGFNKSHAAAYAVISYQTAYLKANHPLEFFVASLNLEIDDTEKLNMFLEDAKRMGIEILAPDINTSLPMFSIENNAIRYGLAAIKGVGQKAMQTLVEHRPKKGFHSLLEIWQTCPPNLFNKRMLQQLVKAGAFDSLEQNRHMLFINVENILSYIGKQHQHGLKQMSLFAMEEDAADALPMTDVAPWHVMEQLTAEFTALGFYLSSHPLAAYQKKLDKLRVIPAADIMNKAIYAGNKGIKIAVAGALMSKRIRSSARGRYAFLQLADQTGLIEISIFKEEILLRSEEFLQVGTILFAIVDLRYDDSGQRAIVEDIKPVEQAVNGVSSKYKVLLYDATHLTDIKNLLKESGQEIILCYRLPSGEIANLAFKNKLFIDAADIIILQNMPNIEISEL